MKTRRISIGVISALFAASLAAGARADLGGPSNPTAPLAQNGSAFTYQGQLRKNGAPVNASCDASFSLYDAATGGAQVGGTVTSPTLQVANGLFTIPLDFGWNFNGEARWLESAIGCGEAPTILTPRTALRPATYAFALPGMRTVPGNNDGGGNPTMNVIGGVVSGAISNTVSANSFNSVVAGGVENRIDNGSNRSAIGGGTGNIIDNSSILGVIAGGNSNIINGSIWSAIGGGLNNRIDKSSDYSAIAGGIGNIIDNGSDMSAIASGIGNTIDYGSGLSVIGGGSLNRIDSASLYSAIGAGQDNVINAANHAVIPGGYANRVEGDYGFAAGRRAKALHDGAFVWGDSTNADIASTAANQFIVRASGGAQLIGVASPAATQLTVAGVISTTGGVKFPDGKTQTSAAPTPSNMIIVAKSGGDYTSISAALTSITDNSAANRYLVYVAPGTYTETVTMKPYIDIEGAGELATKITQVGNLSGVPTLSGADNAELRFLTVENTGGFDFAVAIRNVSASPRLTQITARALNGAETDGIKNVSSSPKLEGVTASATSAGGNYGMYNTDSSPNINNSVISASGGTNFGIYNATAGGSFTVRVTNSQIAGSSFTIVTVPSYAMSVISSQLNGGAIFGGAVTCVGVYDENFAAPGYTTCP